MFIISNFQTRIKATGVHNIHTFSYYFRSTKCLGIGETGKRILGILISKSAESGGSEVEYVHLSRK